MTDRRRQSRFLFLAPADAHVQITIDGDVERWQDDLAVVISAAAAVQGDEFVMQFDSPTGESTTRVARVLGCDPIVVGDALRFRLRLSTSPPPPKSDHRDGVAP
jgi:hypothetical protein